MVMVNRVVQIQAHLKSFSAARLDCQVLLGLFCEAKAERMHTFRATKDFLLCPRKSDKPNYSLIELCSAVLKNVVFLANGFEAN